MKGNNILDKTINTLTDIVYLIITIIFRILKLKNLGDGGWNSFIIANILLFGFFAIIYFFVKVLFKKSRGPKTQKWNRSNYALVINYVFYAVEVFFESHFVLSALINFLAPACSNCSAKKIAVSSNPNITPLQVVNSPLIFRATRIAAAARDVGPSEIFVSFFTLLATENAYLKT